MTKLTALGGILVVLYYDTLICGVGENGLPVDGVHVAEVLILGKDHLAKLHRLQRLESERLDRRACHLQAIAVAIHTIRCLHVA